jgi:hypothetical protein
MAVNISKPAVNLRELLSKVAQVKPQVQQETFWFDGDSSTTDFALPRGWKPKQVFVNGGLYRDGASEDYTVTYDGFIYTVSMAVAPAAVDIGIVSNLEV